MSSSSSTDSTNPYESTAFTYKKAGWLSPLPVGYVRKAERKSEGVPVDQRWHPRRKLSPPAGFTGHNGAIPSGPDIQSLIDDGAGVCNVALHLSLKQRSIGVDLDRAGAREEIEAAAGAPFPATLSSTSRGAAAERRILFYRATLPEGRVWMDHPVPGVDTIHQGHRYAVVNPSIHPATGETYEWYDAEGELYEGVPDPSWAAELPEALMLAMSREGTSLSGAAANDEEVQAVLASLRPGPMCSRMKAKAEAEIERIKAATESIRTPGKLLELVALAIEGHAGGGLAFEAHREAYLARREEVRSESDALILGDWWRQFNGAVGKMLITHEGEIRQDCDCEIDNSAFDLDFDAEVTMPVEVGTNLPEEFWAARSALKHIRQAAHSRGRSADLVLHSLLARLAAMSSHRMHFCSVLGEGSLNYFVAAVGASGTGKSSASRIAGQLLARPAWLSEDFPDGIPVGSGEGLAEAYMGWREVDTGETYKNGNPKVSKLRMQVRHNAYFYVDEGQQLTQQSQRVGATIGPVLRQGWAGATLGQQNASSETTRVIKEGVYSLGLVIGYQPATATALLAEVEPGTPQRFAWCLSTDPSVPDELIEWPDALPYEVHPLENPVEDRDWLAADAERTAEITFPDEVNRWLHVQNLRRVRGQAVDADLDSHMMLMVCKMSALLALLDNRIEVSLEDWALAGALWRTSCAVRDSVIASAHEKAAEVYESVLERHAEKARAAKAAEGDLEGLYVRVGNWAVKKIAESGPMTLGALKKKANGAERRYVEEAVQRDQRISAREGSLYV